MTNYEYLRSLPLEDFAKEIFDLPGCYMDIYIATFIEWLKSERET